MPAKIVTLTSDFGLQDVYVAEVKAVILSVCPEAIITDVTHEVEKFNLRMGAFMLASVVPYFPKGTVHVAVVDPGVGAGRRAILIQTRQGFFVGPDNGLLILAALKQTILAVHELTNPKLMRSPVSNTFHGRDVFAPAAAHLANGIQPSDFGQEINDVVKPAFAKVAVGKGMVVAEVLHVDSFGNVITNVSKQGLTHLNAYEWVTVELPKSKLKMRFAKTYAETQPDEALALIGSHGYVELAVNQGNAAETFHTRAGDKIKLTFSS